MTQGGAATTFTPGSPLVAAGRVATHQSSNRLVFRLTGAQSLRHRCNQRNRWIDPFICDLIADSGTRVFRHIAKKKGGGGETLLKTEPVSLYTFASSKSSVFRHGSNPGNKLTACVQLLGIF